MKPPARGGWPKPGGATQEDKCYNEQLTMNKINGYGRGCPCLRVREKRRRPRNHARIIINVFIDEDVITALNIAGTYITEGAR